MPVSASFPVGFRSTDGPLQGQVEHLRAAVRSICDHCSAMSPLASADACYAARHFCVIRCELSVFFMNGNDGGGFSNCVLLCRNLGLQGAGDHIFRVLGGGLRQAVDAVIAGTVGTMIDADRQSTTLYSLPIHLGGFKGEWGVLLYLQSEGGLRTQPGRCAECGEKYTAPVQPPSRTLAQHLPPTAAACSSRHLCLFWTHLSRRRRRRRHRRHPLPCGRGLY